MINISRVFALFSLLLIVGCVESKKSSIAKSTGDLPAQFHAVFYNVENLFDTYDDPKKKDDDFTPAGRNNWTDNRYDRKISQLSKVITEMTTRKDIQPAIIGLAEVENRKVVEDFAKAISNENYTYNLVHRESKDMRGIDVAMMYRTDLLQVNDDEAVRVRFEDRDYTSRDILHVEAEFFNGEAIDIFLNHWPSRREGQQESEHRRLSAATTLREEVDEVIGKNAEAKILIMGDFNDYPDNKSMVEILDADDQDGQLVNLAYTLNEQDKGTYNYRGDWGMLDQAIVSDAFFNTGEITTTKDGLSIFKEKFMLYYDKKHKEHKPNRTFGHKYFGGYSDHLPIVVTFEYHKK